MNILLLNQNPVVEKLVTLSAHKLGATVVSADSSKELEAGDYDLLIVDEGVYGFEIFGDLAESVTYKKSLYLHARDSEPVDIFNYQIKKPFLPTDLVELLSKITQNILQGEGKATNTFEAVDHHDNEVFEEIDDLPEDAMDPTDHDDKSFNDDNFTEDPSFIEDNSFSDSDDFASDLMDEDEPQDTFKDQSEDEYQQVLDQDDVHEVQKLLEDEETSSLEDPDKESLIISDLDDFTLDNADNAEEPTTTEDTKTLLKEELDEIIEHDFADDLHSLEMDHEPEKLPQSMQIDRDDNEDEKIDEETDENAVAITDEDIAKKGDDTDDALNAISMQIEEKMHDLDDDTLNAPVELPLALEDTQQSDDMLDEFSSLDEDMLKAAIAEDDEEIEEDRISGLSSVEMDKEDTRQDDAQSGAQALTTLLKALQDEGVQASLKGMNIDIHISIGPAK